MTYDVIIVGGGIAGLSTAVRCTELDLKPIVLEKGEPADYPCNARFSGGIVHVAEKEMRAPEADILAKIDHLTDGVGSGGLAAKDGRTPVETQQWLLVLRLVRQVRTPRTHAPPPSTHSTLTPLSPLTHPSHPSPHPSTHSP